jgi:hypothetical protein
VAAVAALRRAAGRAAFAARFPLLADELARRAAVDAVLAAASPDALVALAGAPLSPAEVGALREGAPPPRTEEAREAAAAQAAADARDAARAPPVGSTAGDPTALRASRAATDPRSPRSARAVRGEAQADEGAGGGEGEGEGGWEVVEEVWGDGDEDAAGADDASDGEVEPDDSISVAGRGKPRAAPRSARVGASLAPAVAGEVSHLLHALEAALGEIEARARERAAMRSSRIAPEPLDGGFGMFGGGDGGGGGDAWGGGGGGGGGGGAGSGTSSGAPLSAARLAALAALWLIGGAAVLYLAVFNLR